MWGDSDDWIIFACPDCEARIYVDEGMRETLIRAGCIECGAPVSSADFERA